MHLKTLNRNELDQRIKSLAQKERDLLHEVLLTIKEIDCRRVYLELGFGSLFDYLVNGVGYSEGSAQRRIDAARLIREIPAVAAKIQNGELKLNQISLLQKASREASKSHAVKVTAQEKISVIESLCNKNHSQSQQHVAEFFDLPIIKSQKQTTQADESVRIELTVSKDVHTKILKAQELLSHVVGTRDRGQFLEYLSDKIIKQKTETKTNATASATVAVKSTRGPSQKIIKQVKTQQACCQHIDPQTGHQCRSTWKLQIDHKQSQWAGGTHTLENLQSLCAGHNRMKYRKEAGLNYI